jgi:tetratricopeptide (TPR) repeat protein
MALAISSCRTATPYKHSALVEDSLWQTAARYEEQAFLHADSVASLEAVRTYETIIHDFPTSDRTPDAYLKAGDVCMNSLFNRESYEKAGNLYQRFVALYPKHEQAPRAHGMLLSLYLLWLCDNGRGLAEAKSVLATYPELSASEKATYQFAALSVYMEDGAYGEAKALLQQMREANSDNQDVKAMIEQQLQWIETLESEWEVAESKHLRIHYRRGSAADTDIDRILAAHEEVYSKICGLLRVEVPKKIGYFLFSSQDEATRCNGALLNSSDRSRQVFALYSDSLKRATTAHELTHVIAYSICPLSTRQRLEFLSEGLAEAMVGRFERPLQRGSPDELATKLIEQGQVPALSELLSNQRFKTMDPSITYTVAGSFVDWLLSTYGIQRFKTIYKGLSPRHTPEQVDTILTEVYGRDLEQLKSDWLAYLGAKERSDK